ncbi:MAG: ATP-dependent helicase HrpB [Actinomycetota bacterium]
MTDRVPLPVDSAIPELHDALGRQRLVVLQAPPGTGKTTRVPPSLIDRPWIGDRRVLLLEPRRVAARAAADRMASERGESVGDTIGIRTRFDTRVSKRTRVEVVTEGVLTRMLLSDPSLADYGAVIFDEFHERSIHADVSLAFARETAGVLRDDLRMIIMSATLDADLLAARLRSDAVVNVEAERHPVTISYRPPEPGEDLTDAVARATIDALGSADHTGDLLVFLPGVAAIERVRRRLDSSLGDRTARDLVIAPLHGSLRSNEQDAALRRDPQGRRKVVLATPIAETSVTVDGVATVIDGGQRRRPEIDHGRGMGRLRTVTASRAAVDQRAGRAGRQRPGTCVRIWHQRDDEHRPAAEPPEITTADLSGLALDLAVWGAADADDLPWLDPPPPVTLETARAGLRDLGLLDERNRLTDHGKAAEQLGTDPRLAHTLVRSAELETTHPGLLATAARVAAVLGDTGPRPGRGSADLRSRVDRLSGPLRTQADRWRNRLDPDTAGGGVDADLVGVVVSIAFPDRVAQRRADGRSYLLASGAGVTLPDGDALGREAWLAVAETSGTGADARIVSAAPIDLEAIEAVHGDRLAEVEHGGWDRRARDLVFERQTRLGSIIVTRRPEDAPSVDAVRDGLFAGIRREGVDLLAWDPADERFRARLGFAHQLRPDEWPDVTDTALLDRLADWVGPAIDRRTRRADLERLAVRDLLANLLDWRQGRELDRVAPTHATVPSGSRLPIDYGPEAGPVLAVRLQEVFGMTESPTVGDGAVPLTMHLLSPAHRPLQVTRDLASFWADGYPEVRKEMRGRYPKHHWPEDPLTATPTNRAKRRS